METNLNNFYVIKPKWRSALVLLALNFFVLGFSAAQNMDSVKRKWQYYGTIAGGISKFRVEEVPKSPAYYTGESLLGLRINRALIGPVGIMSGVSLGVKFKRPSYFFYAYPPRGLTTKEPAVELALDYSSSRNHIGYLNVPLTLTMRINPATFIYGGANGRVWFPRENEEPVPDVLSGISELGLIFGISNRLTSRINIGLEYFNGLKDIHHSAVLMAGGFGNLRVTNQYLMIITNYTLQQTNGIVERRWFKR